MPFGEPDSFNVGSFEVRSNPSPLELAGKLNRLREAVEQLRLQNGPGYTVNRTRGGTTLQLLTRPGSASGPATVCPFEISKAVTSSGYTITIQPGTINGLLATNYIACLTHNTTPLTGTTAANRYVTLDVDTDGKQVTSFDLGITSTTPTAPTPTTPLAPTSFVYPLAVVVTSGAVYRLNPCTQLNAFVYESVRVAKTLQSAADNAYDVYYHWVVR